jgi:hypothetical protein
MHFIGRWRFTLTYLLLVTFVMLVTAKGGL